MSSPLLDKLKEQWQARWQDALAAWSSFIKLAEPRWCLSAEDEKREQLEGSFAMIRFIDHAVVISLRQVYALKLNNFAVEIMAHEVGHHVLAPADMRDNARLMARIRAGLPTRESFAGMVSNLYTDLLINDRLQRSAGLDMAAVYKALRQESKSAPVWRLYMRIYEILWNLPRNTLAPGADQRIDLDAGLGARVIRVYGKNWLTGAGRFAALLLPYLLEMPQKMMIVSGLPPWMDTKDAGAGSDLPDGLAEIDDDELEGPIHPAEDAAITGLDEKKNGSLGEGGAEKVGGIKNKYREPDEYRKLAESIGAKVSEKDLVIQYYRECAAPYLIKYPRRQIPHATDPHPEGLDTWEAGMPIAEIDWPESLMRNPTVIPGVTTLKRLEGESPGAQPERLPLDLYIGIDCSGSMGDPAHHLSYPILAGAVITISALRAGAKVMACLSGEPGSFTQTPGFVRDEKTVLAVLTDYLGTGYSFGIKRLEETFIVDQPRERPAHILVVTDADIFHMLASESKNGWQIAEDAARGAGGGATFVLELQRKTYASQIRKMEEIGWTVHTVSSREELVGFARDFARAKYGQNE